MTSFGGPERTFSSIRTAAAPNDVASYRTTPQFAVSLGKLTVMSIVTFGIYDIYWAFKQWEAIRRRDSESLSPLWRAFFAPLWGFSLFPRLQKLTAIHGVPATWSGSALAVVYLLLGVAWRLPAPLSLISFLGFLPILMVQRSVNELNAAAAPDAPRNDTYSAKNIIWIFVGGILVLLAVVGTVMPTAG